MSFKNDGSIDTDHWIKGGYKIAKEIFLNPSPIVNIN